MTASLALLAVQQASTEPLAEVIWRLTAFVARYAHQPVTELHRMPITDLARLARATGELLREESEETKRATDG